MPTGPRFYLSEAGRRTGPHSLAVLKQMADIHVLTADSLIAPESEPDAWSPLRDSQVLCEELLPARTDYALAPDRPVEHVNGAATDAPVPTIEEMLRGNLARERSTEGELLAPIPPRPNRRLKDFGFTLAGGAALSLLPWVFIPLTIGLVILSLGAMLLVTICAAWVFYVVQDRY